MREPSQVGEAKPHPKVGLKQLLEVFLVCSLPGLDFEITDRVVIAKDLKHQLPPKFPMLLRYDKTNVPNSEVQCPLNKQDFGEEVLKWVVAFRIQVRDTCLIRSFGISLEFDASVGILGRGHPG